VRRSWRRQRTICQGRTTTGADRVGGDGQALQDLVGIGPKQQPVLEGGGLPFGGVAHRIAGAGTDCPDRPPLLTGGESCTSPAAEPASCYLLDHRNGPGDQGGLEPASFSGGLVFAEGSRHQVQKGHGGSLRLPKPVPERLERYSSPPVITRSDPVGLLLPEATATLLDQH
jgi:hypothetical protein